MLVTLLLVSVVDGERCPAIAATTEKVATREATGIAGNLILDDLF
jgi:hypothetical protein